MEIKTYNCINNQKVIKLNYKLVISNKNEGDVKNTI